MEPKDLVEGESIGAARTGKTQNLVLDVFVYRSLDDLLRSVCLRYF